MKELLQLAGFLLAPLLISITLVVVIFGSGHGIRARLTSALMLHTDKGLYQQGLLWLSILGPAAYCVAFGSIIWSGYEIALTSVGIEKFTKISSLPLAAVATSIPLSVLVSRFHATRQTAEQIILTRQKNNLDSYYAHRRELFGYFDKICEEEYLDAFVGKYSIHPMIHKNFFSGSPESGVPERNCAAFEDIRSDLQSARYFLDAVIRNINPEFTESFYIANFCGAIYRVGLKLALPEIYQEVANKSELVTVHLKERGECQLQTVGTSTDDAVMAYRYARNYFMNLCDFAGEPWLEQIENELLYLHSGTSYRTIHSPMMIEEVVGRLTTPK